MTQASKDFIEIQRLLNEGYAINKVNIALGRHSGKVSLSVSNSGGQTHEFISTDDDVLMIGFRWKSLHDKSGNIKHGLIKDTEEFYNNIDFLTD
jgi:hypothetical protein